MVQRMPRKGTAGTMRRWKAFAVLKTEVFTVQEN